jgi:hypothetical protein
VFDNNFIEEAPMGFLESSDKVLRKSVLLLLVMVVPAFAGGQKKTPSAPAPRPSAPAPKPNAPAQKAPAQKPGAATRPSAPSPSQTPASHTATAKQTQTKPGQQGSDPKKTGQQTQGKNQKNDAKVDAKKGGKPESNETAKKNNPKPNPKPNPHPGHDVSLKGGGTAHLSPKGQIRSVNKNGMHIEHNLHGGRTVVTERNGARVVTVGKHGGYVQRPYMNRGGHAYYSRTYYDHGVYRTGVYRDYSYGGHHYYGYYPGSYYRPAFYGWAYAPWPGQVYWDAVAWGWNGAPWYGYYGFTPYHYYAGPAFWLTDYLIAANLQAAYAAAAEAPAAEAPSGDVGAGINVIANQPWTDTGTQIMQGEKYTITANGLVNYGGNPSTVAAPEGLGGTYWTNTVAPSLPSVSLVARVGPAGVPFYIGRARSFIAQVGGELFLGVNDSNFSDNSGGWVATINQAGGNGSATQTAQEGTDVVAPTGSDQVTLTPEVKQAIAEMVKAQLKAEQDAAGNSTTASGNTTPNENEVPPALDPASRTFVVSTDLAVVADGQECALTQGDVITRIDDTPDQDQKVKVSVASSKKADCAPGKTVAVSVDDLQEMHNHFQEQLDEGMKTLAKKQGTGNMPGAPDTTTVASNIPPPTPDKSAANTLRSQQESADQTEEQVKQEAGQ